MSTQNLDVIEIVDAPTYDTPLGITNPPIDDLLDRGGRLSKFKKRFEGFGL